MISSDRTYCLALNLAVLVFLTPLPMSTATAQLFTMNEECRNGVAQAEQLAENGDYRQALDVYAGLVEGCDTRDGVETIQTGIAHAHNETGNYNDAYEAANIAWKSSKHANVSALFERARAQENLGNAEAATADYDRMIELTEANQNISERATLYAKVANMNYRAGKSAEAQQYIEQAMQLDPDNPDPYIVRGDWAANDGDYEAAFADYDRAVAMGRAGVGMYATRSDTRIKMMQEKYGTENAQELRGQMTPEETNLVCSDTKKALELGLRDMQMDMFAALVCR